MICTRGLFILYDIARGGFLSLLGLCFDFEAEEVTLDGTYRNLSCT